MIDFLKEKKVIIFIVLIAIILIGKNIYDSTQKYDNSVNENQVIVNETKEEKGDDEMIAVHITGAIKKEGVVRVKENSRIEDVIEKAGGLSEDADITNVNLAFVVEDGVKIRIPSINDEKEVEIVTENSGNGVEVSDMQEESSNGLININKATETELETLNGIGPSLALKIIEYREKNGKFKTVDDIKNVPGIGENKFNNIKDYIDV